MFKTIIADLDAKNITGIKNYITNTYKDFNIEKVFTNKSSFNKYIKEKEIDLVIMEVRFFGVEILKNLNEITSSDKNIKFLLYGTLNDIDYLKKSLEFGVISYAIRPVKPIDLQRCLNDFLEYNKSIENMQKEEQIIDMHYLQQFKVFEDKFLNVLINEKIFEEEEIESNFEYFNINIEPPYTIILFKIDNFRTCIKGKTQKEKHMTIFRILKIIENSFENTKVFINLFNEAVVILGGKHDHTNLYEFLENLKMVIREELNISVSCGVGKTYKNPTDINISFLDAQAALRYRSIVGYNSVIFAEYVEPLNIFTSRYPYKKERNLVYAAVIGEYEYCVLLLDRMFKQLEVLEDKIDPILSQIIMSILISINRNAFEQGLQIEPVAKFFNTREVLEVRTVNQAYEFLKKGLKDFCDYITEVRKNIEEEILNKILAHIEEFYREEISYKILYKKFDGSPKYLKKIFEEHAQMPLENYVAQKRIEVAKDLINTTSLTDDLIALKVGYDDVSSFRKSFKSVEGCLVGDYRQFRHDSDGRTKRDIASKINSMYNK